MHPYRAYRSISLIVGLSLGILAGLAVCIDVVIQEISREIFYRRHYGVGWQSQFASDFEPVSNARVKALVAVVGALAIVVLLAALFRILRRNPGSTRKKPSHRLHIGESSVGRVTRFRRNAVVAIYFGVVGIFAGVLLVLFRFGIFADHENESILGIAVFVCGYCSVIAGCGYWLKAKSWPEALVSVGMMPLIILFIPFVRLIFFFVPALLPIAMVVMPLILIVVTAVLPDRSGVSRQKPYWARSRSPGSKPVDPSVPPGGRQGD
jgi:MFS family permease